MARLQNIAIYEQIDRLGKAMAVSVAYSSVYKGLLSDGNEPISVNNSAVLVCG